MVKKKNEEKYVLYLFIGIVAVVFLLAFVVGSNLTGNVHSNLDLESICENELEGQWLEQHYDCIKMNRDKKDVCENYGGTYNDCGSVRPSQGELMSTVCVHICKMVMVS